MLKVDGTNVYLIFCKLENSFFNREKQIYYIIWWGIFSSKFLITHIKFSLMSMSVWVCVNAQIRAITYFRLYSAYRVYMSKSTPYYYKMKNIMLFPFYRLLFNFFSSYFSSHTLILIIMRNIFPAPHFAP